MNYKYKEEKELYSSIKGYFINKSFRYSCEEIRFYERRIDIATYSNHKQQVISVEAKLTNWLKAFQQALIYQLCSDLVYVAMPKEKFNCINQYLFKKNGIGFLAVYSSGRCRELISPKLSESLRDHYRKGLIKCIEVK